MSVSEKAANAGDMAVAPISTRAIYTVAVLFVINLVGYLDRQIITLLVQPIKASLNLSDGQIGLMQGTAFVLTFSVASLFMGRLVDRRNRRNILIACVAVWSVSAAMSGLTQNAWQLFIARMGVGVGEAALLPTALSLISDSFCPERRGKALGFFMTGVYAGVGMSLVLVAFALPSINRIAINLVLFGHRVEPWRLVMWTMLVPGLICCALLSAVREPTREFATHADTPLDWSGVRDWFARARLFIPHHVGFGLVTLCGYAVLAWLPTILVREHSFDARRAGLTYGVLVAVSGCASAYLGGVLGDRRSRVDGPRGRIGVALYGIPVGMIGFAMIAFMSSSLGVLVGAVLVTGGLGIPICIGFLSISDLSPPESRGQISSIFLACTGLIGSGGGPALVGYGNDAFGGPTHPLSAILGVIGVAACVISVPLILLARQRIVPAAGQTTFAEASPVPFSGASEARAK